MEQERDLQYLLLRIKNKYDSLPHALRKIADFLLEHHSDAAYMGITELASKSGVSEGTVTNFVRAMGYTGYHEFRICMARSGESVQDEPILYGEISLNDEPPVLIEKVFRNNMDAISKTLKIADPAAMDRVAGWIARAKRVDFYGQSSSALVAMNTANRLLRTGVRAYVSDDPHMQISSAALLGEGDVAIGISNTGRSPEIARALRLARDGGAHTVCITSHDDSPVADNAEVKLFTAVNRREMIEDLPSRIAQISLLDALYVCVTAKTKRKSMKNLHLVLDALNETKG